MKTTAKIFILFLATNLITLMVPQKISAQVSISFQLFYDDLSPHGYWINNPEYGYVWVPKVSGAFIPYGTNGHWVFTNVGWTWVSDYSWGWAPFHYGRWFYDPYYGWIWVPGYDWGPGWVTWRVSEGYYGWAPIGPGISISIAYSNGYRLPYNQWIFVRDRDFGRPNIYNYYIPSSRNATIINNSKVINNIKRDNSTQVRYNAGPDRNDVRRRTGATLSPITLKERNRPGQSLNSRELGIYRPKVEKRRSAAKEPAPSKVMRLKDLKPAAQRNVRSQPQKENQQQRNDQPVRKQPTQEQRNAPVRQQAREQQVKEQQVKEQQFRQQQAKGQQMQQQTKEPQARQQQMREQRNDPHRSKEK
ncbi:DUF6600 domain-containing protein [Flavobacterium sp. ZS1P14]|uniref:DUF6600 domain-containing protein n=1 Tax=Flavobacterium sp. ZS1P14 TaxID=3401729 RepID=UPI003AADA334